MAIIALLIIPKEYYTWKKNVQSFFGVVHQSRVYLSTVSATVENKGKPKRDSRNKEAGGIVGDVRTLANKGRLKEAFDRLCTMEQLRIRPDSYTYACLVQGCIAIKSIAIGKQVYVHMKQVGFRPDVFLQTKLITMFLKCGSLVDARQVFDEMHEKNAVTWTTMIAGYALRGQEITALALFYQMRQESVKADHYIYASILRSCAGLAVFEQGKQVHADIVKSGFQWDLVLCSALVDMYAKCNSIEDARKMFDEIKERDVVSWNGIVAGYSKSGNLNDACQTFHEMPLRNVVSWTTLMSGYTQLGNGEESLILFKQMQRAGIRADEFTLASVFAACADLSALMQGKQAHAYLIKRGFESDRILRSALVDMYANCRSMDDAYEIFDEMPQKDIVSWNGIIAGYMKCGNMVAACQTFNEMPEKNVISWTTMIAGYINHMHCKEALAFARQMHIEGIKPDNRTFISFLQACAGLGVLEQVKQVHAQIITNGLEENMVLTTAFIDSYAKCGSIDDARALFDCMPHKDVVSWNAIITAYGKRGFAKEALQLFEQMQQAGTKPNHITFIGVLSACSRAGLVDEGRRYFDNISRDSNIACTAEHYACMIDILGHAGRLDEAHEFVNQMPIRSTAEVWEALLSASRAHHNVELGRCAAEFLIELKPQHASAYVVLLNIYGAGGLWEDAAKVRKLMEDRGVRTDPACSKIEIKHVVHTFLVGDSSHPQIEEIIATLKELDRQMKELGYVPDANLLLHDVEEEQKEHNLKYHSEKLAIAFGLISLPCGTLVRIVKNLRMCPDCHTAAKFISNIVRREIILRDANHFHHFKNGLCSCGDYW